MGQGSRGHHQAQRYGPHASLISCPLQRKVRSTLLRRKKKSGSTPAEEAQTAVVDGAGPDAHIGPAEAGATDAGATNETAVIVATDTDADADAQAPDDGHSVGRPAPGRAAIAFAETPVPAPAPAMVDPIGNDVAPESAAAVQRRQRYAPSDAPLAPPHGGEEHLPVSYWVGSVQSVLKKSGTSSAEERERGAAADFQAAIMPGLMGLRDAVPDAASPDDALRALAEREAEHDYPEDPEGLSLAQRDIFRTDASVYYRIRNRFDKPRRKVGWNNPWRPPPGLARPDPPKRALNRGE